MKTAAVRLAFALFAATLLCSCEKDKARDKWEDAKEKAGASDENAADVTAAGTWTGTSGKNGAKTVLVLTDKSGDVSGTATWTGSESTNAVSVSGTRTARNAMLYVDGDWWRLAIKGDKMWGSGEDAKSHDSYNLSFVR